MHSSGFLLYQGATTLIAHGRAGFQQLIDGVAQDHGVSSEVIDGIFRTAETFFNQPLETKAEIHYKKSRVLHGYEPISEVLTDESKRADLNEAFNCGYEPDLDPAGHNCTCK